VGQHRELQKSALQVLDVFFEGTTLKVKSEDKNAKEAEGKVL
jgi:hypothetical protein